MNAGQIQVTLLGGFSLQTAHGKTLTRFRTRQAASLLAFLIFHPRSHPRELLADTFWPDAATSDNARLSLSVSLSSLKTQLGAAMGGQPHPLLVDTSSVGVRPGVFTNDVHSFEEAIAAEDWELAAARYTGLLLPGFYENWVIQEQVRLRDDFHRAIRHLVRGAERRNDLEAALRWQRAAVDAEPTDADSVLRLIATLRLVGRDEEVARTYFWLERRLRDDYDLPVPASIQKAMVLPSGDLRVIYVDSSARKRGRPKKQQAEGAPPPALPVSRPAPLPEALPTPRRTISPLTLAFSPLYGRSQELEHLYRCLVEPSTRLVTLTGMTGIGKTRLAVALVERFRAADTGVLFVPLAECRSEAEVRNAIATALQEERGEETTSNHGAGGPTLASLARELRQSVRVLVLDNFEQLMTTTAPSIVAHLLAQCPEMKCLVTSQRRLPIPGEVAVPVTPLGVPAPEDHAWASLDEQELQATYPAIALFLDRARNILPDFTLPPSHYYAFGELMQILNGIPLAIELAAARVNILGVDEIRGALMARIGLLSSERVTPEVRHRSLEASLRWSYDLLHPDTQRFFCRLALFHGSFSATDTVMVTGDPQAFDHLASLVDASLLHSTQATLQSTPQIRLYLLDIVRIFALEQLSPEEKAEASRRHSNCFVERAIAASAHWRTPQQQLWLGQLYRDHDNLIAACRFLESDPTADSVERAYRAARALNYYWMMRGQREEGIRFLTWLLNCPMVTPQYRANVPTPIRISTLNALGVLLLPQGDTNAANQWFLQAEAEAQAALDTTPTEEIGVTLRQQITGVQVNRALAAQQALDLDTARHLLEGAVAYYRHVGNERQLGLTLCNLAAVLLDQGEWDAALTLSLESRALAQRLDDRVVVGNTLLNEGEVTLCKGERSAAFTSFYQAVSVFHDLRADDYLSRALLRLSVLLPDLGQIVPMETRTQVRTAAWTYRLTLNLPHLEFMKPPYSLSPPSAVEPLSLSEAEARLLTAAAQVLRLDGYGSISPEKCPVL